MSSHNAVLNHKVALVTAALAALVPGLYAE